jgi:hypothetical protein
MVLRSKRELLSQIKEQEDEIAALHLQLGQKDTEVCTYTSPSSLSSSLHQLLMEYSMVLLSRSSGSMTCACEGGD